MVGSMDVDHAVEGVHIAALVKAGFQTCQSQDAGDHEVGLMRTRVRPVHPALARGFSCHEYRSGAGILPILFSYLMKPGGCAMGIHFVTGKFR